MPVSNENDLTSLTTCIFLTNYISQPLIHQKAYRKKPYQPMTAKKVPISQLGKKIENLAKYAYRWGVWFILWMCFSRRTKEQIQLERISRKRKHSHYKSLDSYFQVDEKSMRWGGHHLNLPKDDLRVKYSKKLKA